MSPADANRLQEVYRREYRSLLQYAREASPYTSVPDRPVRDSVMRIANEESAALQSFGEVLETSRVALPQLGSFPMNYTDLNFVTIRHLVPKLIAEQKRDVMKLESELPAFADVIVRAAMQKLVDLHQRHLKEMEAIG